MQRSPTRHRNETGARFTGTQDALGDFMRADDTQKTGDRPDGKSVGRPPPNSQRKAPSRGLRTNYPPHFLTRERVANKGGVGHAPRDSLSRVLDDLGPPLSPRAILPHGRPSSGCCGEEEWGATKPPAHLRGR
ncbi:hypothetical protein MRX96_032672 [Rhipicephalus microplus]